MIMLAKLGPLRLLFLSLSAILLAANITDAAPVATSRPPAKLRSHPLGGNAPVLIRVGLYVAELPIVDEAAEDYELQGYIYASWPIAWSAGAPPNRAKPARSTLIRFGALNST